MLEASRRMAQRWKRHVAADGTTCCILFEADRLMALRWKRRITCPNGSGLGPGAVKLGSIVDSALGCGVRHALGCMRWVW